MVLMIAQSILREMHVRTGAVNDVVSWLCAAAAFFAMAHAFKHGDFVRVTLLLEKSRRRRSGASRSAALSIAAVAVGYLAWWANSFTYESFVFNDIAQGMLPMPMWIPQVEASRRLDPAARRRSRRARRPSCAAPAELRRRVGGRHAHGGLPPSGRLSQVSTRLDILAFGAILLVLIAAVLHRAGRLDRDDRSRSAAGSGARRSFVHASRARPVLVVLGVETRRGSWRRCRSSSGWARSCSARASRRDVRRARAVAEPHPGRLMHTTILGCGIFGSVSGSSAATCATISKVALPELLRRGYDEKIALGSLATAGTLGILIPPSITMVVYAVAADASIIRIFLAGFLPGFLLMGLFSATSSGGRCAIREDAAARRADELHRQDQGVGQPHPVRCADRLHRLGPRRRLRDRDRMRGLRRARLARPGRLEPHAHLEELLGRADGDDAHLLHDHVHPRRRLVPDQDDGLHRHSARARRVGRQRCTSRPTR
jgi:hypothetical protein